MEQLLELGIFAGKTLMIVLGLVVVIVTIAVMVARQKGEEKKLEIEDIGKKIEKYKNQLLLSVNSSKSFLKEFKKEQKKKKKLEGKEREDKPRTFVLEFEGDIKASAVEQFRETVTAVLSVADKNTDQVVVVLESSGGMVHTYGLAAAQIKRLKNSGLKVSICVDKVAASGGYMMACLADKLYCSPFAIIGSIGVVAQVPNLHRFLKKNDIDYEEMTAGEFKRTVSLLAEITDKGKQKFIEQLELTHGLFKTFVSENRPQLDVAKVATGEYWYGYQAIELKLVDEIKTSDELLFESVETNQVYKISIQPKKNLSEKLAEAMSLSAEKFFSLLLQKNHDQKVAEG